MGLTTKEKLAQLFGTPAVIAYPPKPAKDVRTAGGQFAKGGGRVPGRAGLAEPNRKPLGPVSTVGVKEVDRDTMRDKAQALANTMKYDKYGEPIRTPEYTQMVRAQRTKDGAFADQAVRDAHSDYIGTDYGRINNSLRLGESTVSSEALDRAFTPPPAAALATGTKLYRGVRNDDLGPTLKPGDRFVDDGFVSTSFDANLATNFSRSIYDSSTPESRTMYRITAKAQNPVIVGNSAEEEVLLPRGSAFTVTGVTQYTNHAGATHRIIDVDWDGTE